MTNRTTTTSSNYNGIRAAIVDTGEDVRVEVNQRALIDKILARYATAGAVYRELLQNSNDAEATTAEIFLTTTSTVSSSVGNNHNNTNNGKNELIKVKRQGGGELVSEVIYRNNGIPFRSQDWARLRKIAEGNPDESKVGAFGVGAYTMFSICEEPLVVSGEEALAFFWKGDALWTKSGKNPNHVNHGNHNDNNDNDGKSPDGNDGSPDGNNGKQWTAFILPSRDPYPVPDLIEFGQFLASALTFTQCLRTIRVFVNQTLRLSLEKSTLETHVIRPPKASSWWKNDGAVTSSSLGLFSLLLPHLTHTTVHLQVSSYDQSSTHHSSLLKASYASALATTHLPSDLVKRMIRVTKKNPPKKVPIHLFLDAANPDQPSSHKHNNPAQLIAQSIQPTNSQGRIFIGFRTSQTTGFGIHIAAPLLPTVEREAIDLVDPDLRLYNSQLLETAGILMRLVLEHSMNSIGLSYDEHKIQRDQWELDYNKTNTTTATTTTNTTNNTTNNNPDTNEKKEEEEEEQQPISTLFQFATYLTRGVKNTLVDAIKSVPDLIVTDNETTLRLLNPPDPRPLSIEERHALLLMRAYSPKPSTPEPSITHFLTQGFTRCCKTLSPPVLTRGGILRGNQARLCHYGMETFCNDTIIVRKIMYENAKEYHDMVKCIPLTKEDLIQSLKNTVLEELKLIQLLNWWSKFVKVDSLANSYGIQVKESIRFISLDQNDDDNKNHDDDNKNDNSKNDNNNDKKDNDHHVRSLESILYYVQDKTLLNLPLPETTFQSHLQQRIGLRTLQEPTFQHWFSPLPMDIWTGFITTHSCWINASPEEHDLRLNTLLALSHYYDSLPSVSQRRFIHSLPKNAPCLPVDDEDGKDAKMTKMTKMTKITKMEPMVPMKPEELYLYSTDLSAFEGVGSNFRKVHKQVTSMGVSEAFLLAMGVRKTISMDFLFLHLDTLQWNENPKPLINYLLQAELTHQDLTKLRQTRYLPAENDTTQTYAPSELYIPNNELSIFPFVIPLQWPASEGLSSKHRSFLLHLGVKEDPPLSSIMNYLQREDVEDRHKCLEYLARRLGNKGLYEQEYMASNKYRSIKCLPCLRQHLETGEVLNELQSPLGCYYNPSALVMGFSVLDPQLDTLQIASRFRCEKDPSPQILLKRLIQLVNISKAKLDFVESKGKEEKNKTIELITTLFEGVFLYLSSRTSDFDKSSTLASLSKVAFIPCKSRGGLTFYLPSQVFFKQSSDNDDSLAETLFQEVEFNAFLSLAGVKAEPTLRELFDLIIQKPDVVLDCLGESKYKMLLRRIAADPPFRSVNKNIRSCPFLLGYIVVDEEVSSDGEKKTEGQSAQYILARADDIYIVDNSFLRRQFSMLVAPMEQQLEEFYNRIGSRYVSEVVKKEFEVQGRMHRDTALTKSFSERIHERKPLLISPTISSRPLVPNAAKILDDQYLEVVQVDDIKARYSFERTSKRLNVTCCSKSMSRAKIALFLTDNFDWFDVGTAIGGLILQRCQLEDAFFLSSLLEAPLDTLRSRGFPVDRVLRPIAPPPPPPPPPPQPKPQPQPTLVPMPKAPPEEQSKSTSKGATANGPMNGHTNKPTNGHTQDQTRNQNQQPEGFEAILQQMFPTCSKDVLRRMLGNNPTKEKAREIANQLAMGNFPSNEQAAQRTPSNEGTGPSASKPPPPLEPNHPKKIPAKTGNDAPKPNDADDSTVATTSSQSSSNVKSSPEKAKKSSGLVSRMFGGFRPQPSSNKLGKRVIQQQQQQHSRIPDTTNANAPSSPQNDASNQQSLEEMLQRSIESSRSVNNAGVSSPETLLQSVPHGLERGSDGCEVIPSQNIRPFQGPYGTAKARNGIRVFAASSSGSTDVSLNFLSNNFDSVDHFAIVLQHLCHVYSLPLSTVAIYYEPNGGTIAFNSSKALYFNLRFFCSLHRTNVNSSCYSYWFTTMAHELAHNLCTAHNKEHATFTESYVALYLPKLATFLSQNGIR